MRLDPGRVADAKQRADALIAEAEDLEREARSKRNAARVMRIRWGLLPAPEWDIPGVPAGVTNDTNSGSDNA